MFSKFVDIIFLWMLSNFPTHRFKLQCPKSGSFLGRSLNAELSGIGTPMPHFYSFCQLNCIFSFLLCSCCWLALSYLVKSELSFPSPLLHSVVIYLTSLSNVACCCIHHSIHLVDFCIVSQIIKTTLKSDPPYLWGARGTFPLSVILPWYFLLWQTQSQTGVKNKGKELTEEHLNSSCLLFHLLLMIFWAW